MKQKALSVNIFKDRNGDCSNGGISSKYDSILVLHDEGWIDVDMDNPPENLCKLVKRNLWGETFYHVEPVAAPTGIGWMFGGSLVYSSDGRFSTGPLKLHDRQESQELYDALSR